MNTPIYPSKDEILGSLGQFSDFCQRLPNWQYPNAFLESPTPACSTKESAPSREQEPKTKLERKLDPSDSKESTVHAPQDNYGTTKEPPASQQDTWHNKAAKQPVEETEKLAIYAGSPIQQTLDASIMVASHLFCGACHDPPKFGTVSTM